VRLLLDTSTFCGSSTTRELSPQARELFVDPENETYLSSVAAWEIAIKYGLGRLPLPQPPDRFIPAQREQDGIDPLELDEEAALHLIRLPQLHKDPFDRILVCQAIVHHLIILNSNDLVTQYPVRTIW
jgi:PIN domain nuclease of toxin-antitoxin system